MMNTGDRVNTERNKVLEAAIKDLEELKMGESCSGCCDVTRDGGIDAAIGKLRDLQAAAPSPVAQPQQICHDCDVAPDGTHQIECPEYAATLDAAASPVAQDELTPLDYRAQGREEALAIILQQDPEEALADCTGSSAIADTGDYDAYWDEDKLRELLNIDDRKHDAFGRAEAAYWEAQGHKYDAERAMNMVERAPYFKRLHDVLAKHQEWDLLHDLQAARAATPAQDKQDGPTPLPAGSQQEAVDAARYQGIRQMNCAHNNLTPEEFDLDIDAVLAEYAAMQAQGEKNER